MKNKRTIRLFALMLAAVLALSGLSVTAYAGGGPEDVSEGTPAADPTPTEGPEDGGETEDPAVFLTDGDLADLLSALSGTQVKITVTEDGIQITAGGTEETGTYRTGTVTTNGGRLNVRTGAGLDNTAFTQLPNGTSVKVTGTDGDWIQILLPERVGYVYSGYMTVSGEAETEGGSDSFSLTIDREELSSLLELFAGGFAGWEGTADSESGSALTPDGNLSLIDDIGSATGSGKQFITVESKNGNVFYLIIDRDDKGEETIHFLNQVDEADLLSLMEDGTAQAAPVVCSCTEKCAAGAVNTACPVCLKNMAECAGKEPAPTEPDETEPEQEPQEEKGGNAGLIVLVLAVLAAGGGAAFYFFVVKPKQGKKPSPNLDDLDLEDEDEYLNEDETEEP